MSRRLVAAAAVLAAAASACDTQVHAVDLIDASVGPVDATPSCAEAESHADLAWIQANVFSKSCVFSSCHKGTANDAAHLSLEPGKSHGGLVDQPCEMTVAMGYQRVVPGDPAMSYLMILIDPKDNTLPGGDSDPDGFDGPIDPKVGGMPYNSPLLCKEKIGAIQRWIEAGAPSDTPDAMPADAGVDAAPGDAGVPDAL